MVRCECGQEADPDWGQCYECWLRDRPPEPDWNQMLADEYNDELRREYEEGQWREYLTGLWETAARTGTTELAQPGCEEAPDDVG